jgi:hypothetical protein
LSALGASRKDPYVPLAPDFIVEGMSASDRMPDAQAKMRMRIAWLEPGVALPNPNRFERMGLLTASYWHFGGFVKVSN